MDMAEKCFLCSEKIELIFLDKTKGTVVKIKKGSKTEFIQVCSDCQKKFKEKLKEEIKKTF